MRWLLTIYLIGCLWGCGVQRSGSPPDPQPIGATYLSRGYEYLQQKQWDRAIDEFQRAVALDPASALAHAALGWAYYRAGRPDLALQQGEEVLRLEPENAQVRQLVELLRRQLNVRP